MKCSTSPSADMCKLKISADNPGTHPTVDLSGRFPNCVAPRLRRFSVLLAVELQKVCSIELASSNERDVGDAFTKLTYHRLHHVYAVIFWRHAAWRLTGVHALWLLFGARTDDRTKRKTQALGSSSQDRGRLRLRGSRRRS